MDSTRFDTILASTVADRRLSRGERQALQELVDQAAPDARTLAALRSQVFARAREEMSDSRDRELLEWCEEVVKVLAAAPGPASAPASDIACCAAFSPGEACLQRILGLIGSARGSADICVFTITDDRIARAIHDAWRRRVAVRIISDNDKIDDPGSDIRELAARGIPVVLDRTPYHMHHKFAIFDKRVLLTGSYNWTRSAAAENHENLLVTGDPGLLREFGACFDALWQTLGGTV